MVPEIIRWQTPLAHMRRTALADIELGGKTIRKGDKVVMWYISGNRDEEAIETPTLHHRPRAAAPASVVRLRHPPLRRQPAGRNAAEDHVGGNPRSGFERIEVVGEPKRVYSSFVHGNGPAGAHSLSGLSGA